MAADLKLLRVRCECGTVYSLHLATVCPRCFAWPKNRRNPQVRKAFDMIAAANTVTLLSLDEMESVVNRALAGEFDGFATDDLRTIPRSV